MQETNKAKISMSLVWRQRGERSSHSSRPRPTRDELQDEMTSNPAGAQHICVLFLERNSGLDFGKPITP